MAIFDRYGNREIFINKQKRFESTFEKRFVKSIKQYDTSEYYYPDSIIMQDFVIEQVIWKRGMRFYKLAGLFYNDPEMWWVIAWFNRKPTDVHVKFGDVIFIPAPLELVLSSYGF